MRLLVLSHNSFSKQNSNGRTLGSLLIGWPKDSIAQFCISSDGADFDVCDNYYCVTDGDVLRSTLRLKPAKRRTLLDARKIDANSKNGHVKHRKTSINMFARNIAWNLGIWKGKDFYEWIDTFSPDMILLQSGEAFFMHKLALKLSKRTGAKLAIFNTEGFYFFKKDYFPSDGKIGKMLFRLYQLVYKLYFRKFMAKCDKQIYLNEQLKEDYDTEFNSIDSQVIYTSSSLSFKPQKISDPPIFCYFGNMGYDRDKILIEFANTINRLNNSYKLNVYGFTKSEEMDKRLKSCESIKFHGAVSYDEVKKAMEKCDFLVHVESQSDFWKESLRYGFSTKIADSISSGKIFILYSSTDIACAKYILTNNAGIFASNPEQLITNIKNVLYNYDYYKSIVENARKVAGLNHCMENNANKMRNYLTTK